MSEPLSISSLFNLLLFRFLTLVERLKGLYTTPVARGQPIVDQSDSDSDDAYDDTGPLVPGGLASSNFVDGKYVYPSLTGALCQQYGLGGFVEDAVATSKQAQEWAQLILAGLSNTTVCMQGLMLFTDSELQRHSDHNGAYLRVLRTTRIFAEPCPAESCACRTPSKWTSHYDCESSIYTRGGRLIAAVNVWTCETGCCRREWTGLSDFVYRHSRTVAFETGVCKCMQTQPFTAFVFVIYLL